MNEAQADLILEELSKTRQTFEDAAKEFRDAAKKIGWNRVNTVIQYFLIFLVFVIGIVGIRFYFSEARASCNEHNSIRLSVRESLDNQALTIGIALESAAGASHETFEEYLRVYRENMDVPALDLEDC